MCDHLYFLKNVNVYFSHIFVFMNSYFHTFLLFIYRMILVLA